MKNAIRFFYNLEVDSIRQVNSSYFFESKNNNYWLQIIYDNSFNDKYHVISRYPFLFNVVKNTSNSIITNINNSNFVLVLIDKDKRKITEKDIFNYENIYSYVNDIDPVKRAIELWSNRVDYVEYQISQIGKKYSLLKQSFSYYNGLTESAIQLLNILDNKKINTYLMHHRLTISSTTYDFFNPLNIIFDSRVRDICEYLKSKFFSGDSIYQDVILFLRYFSDDERIFFLARLLYPSYYFDIYDDIINDKENEDKIEIILSKTNSYEEEIKKIYLFLKRNYYFPEIEWLK